LLSTNRSSSSVEYLWDNSLISIYIRSIKMLEVVHPTPS
jgi:hypothetical protein